jgi:hypothetical protein
MIRTASAIEQVSISEQDSEQERLHDQHQSSIINQMIQKLSTMDLPERERGPVLHAPQVVPKPQAE